MVLGKGNCKCLNSFERDILINSLDRSIKEESNTLDSIRAYKEYLRKAGWEDIDYLISAHIKMTGDFSVLKKEIKDTPVCELML